MNRRDFIKKVALTAVYCQIPQLISCGWEKSEVEQYIQKFAKYHPLTFDQKANIIWAHQILFPDEPSSPGSMAIESFPFLLNVLNDPHRDPEENAFLVKGADRLNDFSKKQENKNFYHLDDELKLEIFKNFVEEGGESWASAMLSVIFESLLANPIYGCNPGETGWKWLEYTPGYPQPSADNAYPVLMEKRKKEKIMITSFDQLNDK